MVREIITEVTIIPETAHAFQAFRGDATLRSVVAPDSVLAAPGFNRQPFAKPFNVGTVRQHEAVFGKKRVGQEARPKNPDPVPYHGKRVFFMERED